jgi:hypothetical protein
MTLRHGILLLISASMMAALVACGGPSYQTISVLPISIAFSGTPPISLMVGATLSLTAVVNNDAANEGVAWSVTCGSTGTGACGSFSAATTVSGFATTYTAPLALPTGKTVTVTATSVADSTKSVSSPAITIITPDISVTFSKTAYPPNAVEVGGSAAIAATVTGDTTNQGVRWSCTPAGDCGSFNPATTPSGVSTTYTAPGLLPSGRTVTVMASSVTNPGDSCSIPVFISDEPTTLADGTYVFSLAGTDKNGRYFVAGAFVLSNGAITSGEQDFIDSAVTKEDSITSGSYYAVDDGNLWITLKTADTSIGVSGVETLDATLVSSSKAQLMEFDSSATSSGTLDLQTSKAAPSGGYAFFTAGEDSGKSPTAIGGVINVDGSGAISGTGSAFDLNDFGLPAPLPKQAFAPSMVSAPDSMGRVVFNLIPGPGSSIGQINLVGYIVDASHICLVETADAYGGFTGGTALGQGSSTGTFNASSISGSSYVFGAAGTDANDALQVAGLLSAGSSGSLSGTLNFNDITAQSPQGGSTLSAGSYTVDPTGRVTLTGLTDGSTSPTFNYNLQLYLTGDGHGVLISMDKAEVIAGLGFQQTGPGSFGLDSFSGSYGMNVAQVLPSASGESEQHATGPIAADGAGNLTGFADFNQIPVTAGAGNNLSFSGNLVANANGVFTGQISGLNLLSPSTPDNFTYYLVDKTRAVLIETDNTQLTLGFFVLQQ